MSENHFENKERHITETYVALVQAYVSMLIEQKLTGETTTFRDFTSEAKKRYPNDESVFRALRKNNSGVNLHYVPVHKQPYYRKMIFVWDDFPNSEAFYSCAISLPIYSSLKCDQQNFGINQVKALCDG